jgi:hypothetical protein
MMPEKDEPIYATRARHGIVAHNSPATPARDWTLASAPTQLGYGRLLPSRLAQLCPLPAPATNWQEPLARCRIF